MKDRISIQTQSEKKKLQSRIRELKRELEKLKKSAEILRRAEIAAGTGSWELHLDSGIMYGSEGAKRIYGLTSGPFDYKIVRNIPLPEYRPMMDQAMLDLINTGKPYDITFKIKNAFTGKILDIHSICEFESEKRILTGSIHDITTQKKEEDEKIRDNFDMSVLLKITIELLETSGKRKVLQNIIDSAISIIGLNAGALYLINGEDLMLETSTPQLPADFPDSFRKALLKNHPHIGECVRTRNTLLIGDVEGVHFTGEESIIVKTRNLKSILYIPLVVMDKVKGVLILGTIGKKYDFSKREIDLCRTISNIGSLALENSMLFEQLNNKIDELKSTILKKEKTESSLRLLNRVVDHSPVSIVVTDNEGIIEYVNPKFTELTGYSWNEAISNSPSILKSGNQSREFYAELWNTIISGKDWFGEIKNKKKNGDFYWERVLISPIKDEAGRITHFVGVKEDITEKKAMMEKLIMAKEKAEESDRLKTAFLHNISHEIRTPLNAIVGFSVFLTDPDLSAEKRKTFSDIILSGNDQLLAIIDSIIKISHLEAGQVEISRSDTEILRVTGTLFDQFQLRAKEKNLNFIVDNGNIVAGTRIMTDEGKLKQILSSLLDNAFKFTDKGHVALRSSRAENHIEFRVEDTGIGIEQEEHVRIFERFYQAGKSDSKFYSGAGIGLSICAGYAQLLEGTLRVESSPGKGSVFTLQLPL